MTAMTLGEYLRQEREKRGITIEQVASATKISVKLLHVLEADQYHELPAKPFVRGFVISYCRFINLDPKEVLTRYGTFIDEKAQERPQNEVGTDGYIFERRDGDRSKAWLWMSILSFVVLGAVLVLFVKPALKKKRMAAIQHLRETHANKGQVTPSPSPVPSPLTSPESTPTPQASPSVVAEVSPHPSPKSSPKPSPSPSAQVIKSSPSPSPSVMASPTPKPKPTPTLSPIPTDDPNRKPDPLQKGDSLLLNEVKEKIVLKAEGDIWVRYRIDDYQIQELIVRKGSMLVLKARALIRLQVSDSSIVLIKHRTTDFLPLTDRKDLTTYNNMPTLIVPRQPSNNIEEPFKGKRELKTPPPSLKSGASR